MKKISIIILHYENLSDTKQCLDSLLPYIFNEDAEVNIIVVDNGSRKEKLISIKNEYDYENIVFLYNENNMGFAKGNNVGYRYAKLKLHSDIIILANNDLIFKQYNFIDVLLDDYNTVHFDVAGPKILSLEDGKNQNPVPTMYHSIKDVKIRIFKFYILYLLSFFNLDNFIRNLNRKEIKKNMQINKNDFQLHGACMIFSNNYIKLFDGLCDKTFMYGEESIIKYQCVKYNLKMCYLDNINVYHKEGSSTSKKLGKGVRKRRFFYKCNIYGCKILKKMMD